MERILRRFLLEDERGSAAIEFVIWLPLFTMILGVITDVSMLFNMHARMFDAARDVTRQVAVSVLSAEEAETYGRALFSRDGSVDVDVQVEGGVVRTTVSMPYSDALVFSGIFLGTDRLVAAVTMLGEGGPGAEGGDENSV